MVHVLPYPMIGKGRHALKQHFRLQAQYNRHSLSNRKAHQIYSPQSCSGKSIQAKMSDGRFNLRQSIVRLRFSIAWSLWIP